MARRLASIPHAAFTTKGWRVLALMMHLASPNGRRPSATAFASRAKLAADPLLSTRDWAADPI